MTESEKIVKRYVDCELNEVEFLAEITALTTRLASEAAADMRHRAADRCLAHDGKMYDSEGCYVRQSTMQDVATAILALAPPDGASEAAADMRQALKPFANTYREAMKNWPNVFVMVSPADEGAPLVFSACVVADFAKAAELVDRSGSSPDGASEGRGGPDLDALEATVEKAHKMVSALCQGEQRWIMRVPAEPDNDPDLVIAAGLRVASQLIREARGAPSNA